MIKEESLATFREYVRAVKGMEFYSSEQTAIDGIGLVLAGGDADRYARMKAIANNGVPHQDSRRRAVDAISLLLLGGDVEEFGNYQQAAGYEQTFSTEQRSIDALALILIDRFPQLWQSFENKPGE
ncbi:hypothetical protein ACFL0V_01185 [Nanoarchaeota archaeon]